ncbi:trypsin-like peptidase domain-containing protein [Fibrella sp. HMF5335]|uniref:Trypsin-like peptidase domain-containing protein n=1 Tax=Fibrella rubiginis TaxID=2817060 RepID=A0A939K270_9BACT|nr:serine protease [Fibrella rubiginis]MBO0935994.1 trypsin-like peptidase domain-containing protein [Fibrella rubiginis]
MLPIDQIVKALRLSRDEFATLFLQAQVGRPTRMNFEAVAQTAMGDEAFRLGLTYALGQGFLMQLLKGIVDDQRDDGTLASEMLMKGAEGSADLQAMVNVVNGFGLPKAMAYRLLNGMKWACKVHVDGQERGTGILIGPNLVLTAWHVVVDLYQLNQSNPSERIPDKQAANRLQVEFDNYDGYLNGTLMLRPATSLMVNAHKDWSVCFKTCHEQELLKTIPPVLTELKDCWDYAVIRLARPIGAERRWANLDPNAVVPRNGQRVMVFQHPQGKSLKFDEGPIAAPAVANPAVFPGLRFLHQANTLPGSSGGPCFDQDFMLFGLHQGEWPTKPTEPKLNRGVPIAGIEAHIRQVIGTLPGPDPADSSIWTLGESERNMPVLGCDEFQSTIWQSVLSGQYRLFVVNGMPGSGKTFRTRVLTAMLPASGHLIIRLNGESVSKKSAAELVDTIAHQASQPSPALVAQVDMNTTAAAWLRAEVLPKLLQVLEQARQGRMVWLVLTDLNSYNIDGSLATDLLTLLYEQVATLDWLRIVLDGMRGDLPDQISQWQLPLQVAPTLEVKDIVSYFRRRLAAENSAVDDTAIMAMSKTLFRMYQTAQNTGLDKATRQLATDLLDCYTDLRQAIDESI